MPEPVRSSSPNPNVDAIRERHESAHTVDEVREWQASPASSSEAASELVQLALEEYVGHRVDERAEHALEATGAASTKAAQFAMRAYHGVSHLKTAIEVTKLAGYLACDVPAERGEELRAALTTDQARLAEAMLVGVAAPDALPPRFVASESRRVTGARDGAPMNGLAFTLASRVHSDASAGDAEAKRFVEGLVASARKGLADAQALGIGRSLTIDEARRWPDFRERMAREPGYELGVRAAAWQAVHDPDAYAAARVATAERLGAAQLSRPA